MSPPLAALVAKVQANCNLSDARHARGMTLCTYLLEMRELYRWECGAALTAPLPRAEVGAWLSSREALWDALASEDYHPLPLGDSRVDPFDAATVNAALVPQGLVYGAGVGRFGKPQFFLGELVRDEWRDGARVLVARREYARDVAPAPAAYRDGTIYVRQDALARVLGEKAEAWARKRSAGALESALDAHDYAGDPERALAAMAEAETETLILHELGERAAGRELGPGWERMLAGFGRRSAEVFARAARDHLADCATTLPILLDRGARGSIHLWFGSLDGLRRELAPRLVAAYEDWRCGGGGAALRGAVASGEEHWRGVCAQALALHERKGEAAERAVEALAAAAGTRF